MFLLLYDPLRSRERLQLLERRLCFSKIVARSEIDMTVDVALQLMHQMLWTSLWVAGPIIAVSMIVGLLVSAFQVVTQLQEMTLTFVPKLVAIFFALLIGGGWMLSTLVTYSAKLIASIPQLIH